MLHERHAAHVGHAAAAHCALRPPCCVHAGKRHSTWPLRVGSHVALSLLSARCSWPGKRTACRYGPSVRKLRGWWLGTNAELSCSHLLEAAALWLHPGSGWKMLCKMMMTSNKADRGTYVTAMPLSCRSGCGQRCACTLCAHWSGRMR